MRFINKLQCKAKQKNKIMDKFMFDVMRNLMSVLEKAPKGFCNSDNGILLTHKDIKLRQFSQSVGISSISNKEMVFRKFYELKFYSTSEQIKRIPIQMVFLLKYGLNQDDVGGILEDLVSEINNYNRFPNRIVFNPFS